MRLFSKTFNELTNLELYEILKRRSDIFVVEQRRPCIELDNRDQDALHVFLRDDDGLQAYLRVMDRGVESENVSIGRVITVKRGRGLGRKIMAEGVRLAKERYGADRVYLEAQVYAKGFYEKCGFRQISDEFILDDIPHIRMIADV